MHVLERVLGAVSTERQTPCAQQLGPRSEHLYLVVVSAEVGLLPWFGTASFSTEKKLLNLTVGDHLWICDVP